MKAPSLFKLGILATIAGCLAASTVALGAGLMIGRAAVPVAFAFFLALLMAGALLALNNDRRGGRRDQALVLPERRSVVFVSVDLPESRPLPGISTGRVA